jgi:hypothetical protein
VSNIVLMLVRFNLMSVTTKDNIFRSKWLSFSIGKLTLAHVGQLAKKKVRKDFCVRPIK